MVTLSLNVSSPGRM